ncbi:hypothetical protein [Microbacterium lacticum]
MIEESGIAVARDALGRAAAAIDPDDLRGSTIAAGQALFWACSLDEQLWEVGGYVEARSADEWGRLLPAMRLARNAVAHGAAICVRHQEGLSWPMRWPARWADVYWAPVDVPLAALEKKPTAAAVELYRQMQDRSVGDTLEGVANWFDIMMPFDESAG